MIQANYHAVTAHHPEPFELAETVPRLSNKS